MSEPLTFVATVADLDVALRQAPHSTVTTTRYRVDTRMTTTDAYGEQRVRDSFHHESRSHLSHGIRHVASNVAVSEMPDGSLRSVETDDVELRRMAGALARWRPFRRRHYESEELRVHRSARRHRCGGCCGRRAGRAPA